MTFESRKTPGKLAYKQCAVEKFSKKRYENFFVKDYPYMYFNAMSNEEDFVKLKEKVSFKIDMSTSNKKLMHNSLEDPFKNVVTILNMKRSTESKETVNVLLNIRHYFDQVKIRIYSEYFIINETSVKFKLLVREHNYQLSSLVIGNRKYKAVKEEPEFKYDALIKKNLLGLVDKHDEQKFLQTLKANSDFIEIFSGDLYAPKKTLLIEDISSTTKVKIKISDNGPARDQFTLDNQHIYMSVVPLASELTHKGVIVFYYPFYMVNLTNWDIVTRVQKKSEHLFILHKTHVYSSQDLLMGYSADPANLFKFKANSNDYLWSSSFPISNTTLKNEICYLKIKGKSAKVADLNVQIEISCTSLSTLITLKENKFFHVRIDNQTDHNFYIEQSGCEEVKEVCQSKSIKMYFWANSTHPKLLNVYKKKGDHFILIDEVDIMKQTLSFREGVKDKDLGTLRFHVTEEKEFAVLKIIQEAVPDSQVTSSTTFKLKRFFRESMGLSTYSSIIKNRLYGKRPENHQLQINLVIEDMGLSLCDKGPVELFFISLKKVCVSYSVEKNQTAAYKHFNIKTKDLEVDTQIDIRYNNVN